MPSDRLRGASRRYGAGRRFVQTRRGALAVLASIFAAGRPAAAGRTLKLLCLGDSLTAGYLLPAGQGFAPVLERELRKRGLAVEAIDAGVSGDTASGGAERLDWALGEGADAAVVELGANDMFRGLDPAITRAALESILTRLKRKGVRTVLAGMRASPGLGADYVRRFDRIYPDLARQFDVPLYPFFLEGVAGDRTLNLPDGIHPTRAGVEKIVAGILPLVEAELRKAAAG